MHIWAIVDCESQNTHQLNVTELFMKKAVTRVDNFVVKKDVKLISGMLFENSILLKFFKHQLSPK